MIEAVGEALLADLLRKLADLLEPGGRVALQAITIDELLADGRRCLRRSSRSRRTRRAPPRSPAREECRKAKGFRRIQPAFDDVRPDRVRQTDSGRSGPWRRDCESRTTTRRSPER